MPGSSWPSAGSCGGRRRTTGQDPTCLLVLREAFSPAPDTVHVLAHHQLELTHANGHVDHVDDIQDLHRHLNSRAAPDRYPHHPGVARFEVAS